MESTCFLLIDETGRETALFSGDTLFIGDVGRPDLAVKSDLSREDLAGYLYDSLRNKVMPLRDDITVYPGHGAGSACGKKMANETQSTIGAQKQLNYALRADMTPVEAEFYDQVTAAVRKYCRDLDMAEGFLLTIPQRQMCSSMAAGVPRLWGALAME